MLRSRIPPELVGAGVHVPAPEFDYEPEVVAVLGGGVRNWDGLVVDLQTQNHRGAT